MHLSIVFTVTFYIQILAVKGSIGSLAAFFLVIFMTACGVYCLFWIELHVY